MIKNIKKFISDIDEESKYIIYIIFLLVLIIFFANDLNESRLIGRSKIYDIHNFIDGGFIALATYLLINSIKSLFQKIKRLEFDISHLNLEVDVLNDIIEDLNTEVEELLDRKSKSNFKRI